MYSYGEYNAQDTQETLQKLNEKVADVYTKCIGTNEATISWVKLYITLSVAVSSLKSNLVLCEEVFSSTVSRVCCHCVM